MSRILLSRGCPRSLALGDRGWKTHVSPPPDSKHAYSYDFKTSTHEKLVEELRYIHRNPVRRGLVVEAEDWEWSSFRDYQTGMRGTVEIESEWTARERGWQLPEWMRYRQADSSSPVPKGEGPGPPATPRVHGIHAA